VIGSSRTLAPDQIVVGSHFIALFKSTYIQWMATGESVLWPRYRSRCGQTTPPVKRRQGRFAVDMQGICLSQIEELLRRAEEGQPLNLTVPQMARFIELGAKLERDARGEDSPGGRFTNINVITEGADEAEVTKENQ
jgi:hypothetical protein